ncbi:MAG: hypothetical protein ABIB71_01980 [Candidatus Woesearchaeota archaeon]
MDLKKALVLSLIAAIILVIAGCAYDEMPDSKAEPAKIADEPQDDEECINHYLTKFGITKKDIIIENSECDWTPDDRYGVIDYKFKAQIKDAEDKSYNLFYEKGCCHRHAYPGFTMCIKGEAGTVLFQTMKSKICSQLNNDFDNFTAKCLSGEFEKLEGDSIILSLKNDYVDGASSDIKTVSVESSDCLDLNEV